MTIKTNGLELKKFYNDDEYWPEGVWHDDEAIEVNGVEIHDSDFRIDDLQDTDQVKVTGGGVYKDGGDDIGSFEGRFKSWRKKQATATVIVEIPRSNLPKLKDAIKQLGAKVL